VPGPVRSGLHNFLSNLTEPVVFVNFLLQGKPGKAFETLGRFTVNTTVGVAGLVDVAKKKPFNLPHRNNGFADTLGFYGVGPGPYFFLPIIGPTTLRDLFGWGLDKAFLPTLAGAPFSSPAYAIGSGTVKSLDDRVEFDAKLREFRASDDPYVAERKYYLAQRKAEIEALHGRKAEAPAPTPTPETAPVQSPAVDGIPAASQPVTPAPSEPVPALPPAPSSTEAPSPPQT
jgi:phospholipid-binding lipoprotein MlaA